MVLCNYACDESRAGTLGNASPMRSGRVENFTGYLDVHYVPGTGRDFFKSSPRRFDRGGLGFLWYNAPPAACVHGDTGSLALGGALGQSLWRPSHEIVPGHLSAAWFVVDALSVINDKCSTSS